MFTARKKILKPKGTEPTSFEESVASVIFELQNKNDEDLKPYLRSIFITGAKEVPTQGGAPAVVISVPFRLLQAVHGKQYQKFIRELEKKFGGKHVVIVADRRIFPKNSRAKGASKQMRPRSRTLTSVHDSILDDLVFPTEIVGKRTRVRVDGSKLLKIFLDPKDQNNYEYKLDTYRSVFKNLTGKEACFEFPVSN